MFENITTRLTEEDETETDGESTVQGVVSEKQSDADSSTPDDSTTVDSAGGVAVDEGSALDFDQIFGLLKIAVGGMSFGI